MNNIKKERIKADLKRAFAQVFAKHRLTHVYFTDIVISPDYRYATIELDAINSDINLVVNTLNEPTKHQAILKDLHKTLPLKNFPKIKFAVDSHKTRIEQTETLFRAI